ncbi:hypothetical protein BDD12DRAFT_890921 [Trichophaea hybrida]|nr:hypothetical protein BDD12DRAFT_890921 [Trichophaea hybrida]
MSIKHDRSFNIKGIAGKTTMKGYLIAELDFGQGVKAKAVLYILGKYILNTELILSKLFLVSINAIISMKHDYIMVPTMSEVPVIMHANKYVCDHYSLAKNLVLSKKQLIASTAVIHPTKKEIEIGKKHLKKCASVMIQDWLYFKEEEEIEEEKIKVNEIGEEEEIRKEKEIGEEKEIEEETEIGQAKEIGEEKDIWE